MSDQNDNPSKQPFQSDSRVRTFLRQASGIIAVEKGLTPACRVKLETLAQSLKLPDDMFHQALARLQASGPDLSGLTRYESAFTDFLASEIAKLKGDVLSPQAENAAIEIAQEKYQLKRIRAEHLIDACCQLAEVSRISVDEAKRYATGVIGQRVGEQVFLDSETQEQLLQIGKKWGLDQDEVEFTINQIVESNRAKQLKVRGSYAKPLLGLLMGILMLAGGWWVWGWATKANPKNDRSKAESPVKNTSDTKSVSEWETIVRDFSKRHRTFMQADELIAALKEGTPLTGQTELLPIESMLSFLVSTPDNASIEVKTNDIQSLVQLMKKGTPETAKKLGALLRRLMLGKQDSLSVPIWKSAFRANSLAVGVYQQLGNSKEADLADAWASALPVWWSAEQDARNQKSLAMRQWSQLMRAGYRQPKVAAPLLLPLTELTSGVLTKAELQQLRDETLLAILQSDTEQFDVLAVQVQRSIGEANENRIMQWIERWLEVDPQELPPNMGQWLVHATSTTNDALSYQQCRTRLIQYRRSVKFRAFQPLVDRSKEADRSVKLALTGVSEENLPQTIARLVAVSNVEWSLRKAIETGADESNVEVSEVDRWQNIAKLGLDRWVLPGEMGTDERDKIIEKVRASDLRSKRKQFRKLEDLRPDDAGLKVLAVRQLQRIAVRIPQLELQEAKTLAKFLCEKHSNKHQLELQTLVGAFSNWNRLKIALADEVLASEVSLDQAMTFSRLLLRSEIELPKTEDWRTPLSQAILGSAQQALDTKLNRSPKSDAERWRRLALAMELAYRRRLAGVINRRERSLNELVSYFAANLSAQATGGEVASVQVAAEKQRTAVEALSDNPVQQLVLLNQMSLHVLRATLETKNSRWEKAWKNYLVEREKQRSAGEQLLLTEQMLLIGLQETRKEAMSGLMK